MKYTLSEPIISSGKIIGYTLIEDTGGVKKAKLEDIAKLASRNLVNAEVIRDEKDELHILPNGERVKYDDNTVYTIDARIIHDNKVKSYKCKDNDGNIRNIPIDIAWELAVAGKIMGAKGKIVNGKRTIVSDGTSLSSIRVINN